MCDVWMCVIFLLLCQIRLNLRPLGLGPFCDLALIGLAGNLKSAASK